jgi:hypothetical protein
VDRHLIRFSPFFVLHDDKPSPSRPWLSQHCRRGFEDGVSKKGKLGTTINYLRAAAGIDLGNTIQFLHGAAGIGLGTTIKYMRHSASGAAGNGL